MNRKLEDKLAQMAFGDLSPEESRKLEREAEKDPEARRALTLYQDMRSGLKGLAEIPEDQFSRERLRDAILTQGLKPVAPRPVSSRAWLWMPAAACFLGFGLTFMRHTFDSSDRPTQLVMGKAEEKIEAMLPSKNTIAVAINGTPSAHTENFKPMSGGATLSGHHRTRRHLEPNEYPSNVVAWSGNEEEGWSDFDLPAPTAAKKPATAQTVALNTPTTMQVPQKSNASNSGPIILIDQDKDADTGAQKATEVSSASNVLVGG